MRSKIYEEIMTGVTLERMIRDHEFTMPDHHIHDHDYEVYYLLEGERYYFVDSQTWRLKKGDMIIINHSTVHRSAHSEFPFHDRILIEINKTLLQNFCAFTGEVHLDQDFSESCIVLSLSETEQHWLEALIQDIRKELHEKGLGYRLFVWNRLAELFLFSLRRRRKQIPSISIKETAPSKYRLVEHTARYISEHFAENISLNSVAEHFYVNKCYLSRIFKEVTGFTLNEYIHVLRIEQAKSLLQNSEDTISSIAETCGYETLTYFERVFRKLNNQSPKQYRKQYPADFHNK